ncbi:nucleotidyltransferase family protein [Xylanibacter ruminicola]|nr:nucleotidyltransferase family protein [Xylanibacter ruminicola]
MLFFELLQVALGNRERLSHVPTPEDWMGVYDESEWQAVTGILLHGIDRLPVEQRPPQDILLQWIGVGQMIEQRNHLMDKRCIELLTKLKDAGLTPTILKGQGIAQLYGKELRALRQSGDIDVYVDCGLKKALAFAKSQGQEKVEWDYKHLHLKIWDDTEVEMHYHVEVLLNLWKNRKLQKWFREHENELFAHANDNLNANLNANLNLKANTDRTNDANGFVTPTVEFNVFYILLHIYRHFLYEGVGFRQVIDYYFVLKNLNDNLNVNESYAYKAVREFGMTRFAKGLMWVMHEALGMQRDWMLWEPDEKEGRYILKQVMRGGNFGHHDERLKHSGGKLGAVKAILTHNMHLITHYPSDVIWAPVWIVWHKLWKLTRR